MTFTTKLEVGQQGWYMHENKPISMRIESVTVKVVEDSNTKKVWDHTPSYGFRIYDAGNATRFKEWREVSEKLVFGTKEELLASL